MKSLVILLALFIANVGFSQVDENTSPLQKPKPTLGSKLGQYLDRFYFRSNRRYGWYYMLPYYQVYSGKYPYVEALSCRRLYPTAPRRGMAEFNPPPLVLVKSANTIMVFTDGKHDALDSSVVVRDGTALERTRLVRGVASLLSDKRDLTKDYLHDLRNFDTKVILRYVQKYNK